MRNLVTSASASRLALSSLSYSSWATVRPSIYCLLALCVTPRRKIKLATIRHKKYSSAETEEQPKKRTFMPSNLPFISTFSVLLCSTAITIACTNSLSRLTCVAPLFAASFNASCNLLVTRSFPVPAEAALPPTAESPAPAPYFTGRKTPPPGAVTVI